MNIGMMWFDNNPKTPLTVKVREASAHYRAKYGKTPDTCLVNPSMLAEPQMQEGKVIIRSMRSIMPGHLWIGVDEKLPTGTD